MKKTIITADSTLDLPDEILQKYDIKVFPSYVYLGDKCFLDYPDIKQNQLFAHYEETKTLPQTAAANPNDYSDFFKKYSNADTAIIHIAKSSGISGCYQNACLAADEMTDVFVVDSLNLSSGSGLLAIEASKRKDSMTANELVEWLCANRNKIDGSFIIEQMEYLYKGGRCSSLSYYGANTLRIKPSIKIKDGKMTTDKKYRGKFQKCLFEYIDDKLAGIDSSKEQDLFIAHSIQDTVLLEETEKYIRSKHKFPNIVICPACAAIACHCGPNTFGLFYINN